MKLGETSCRREKMEESRRRGRVSRGDTERRLEGQEGTDRDGTKMWTKGTRGTMRRLFCDRVGKQG